MPPRKTRPSKPPGRPRDAGIDGRVLDAALALLAEVDYGRLSIDAVAARAGVFRPAIYRRWPTKQRLLVDAFARGLGQSPAPDTGDTRRDLVAGVSTLSRAFSGPLGRALSGLVADLGCDGELLAAFRARVFDGRRASMAEALRRGMARGDIDPCVDVELALDLLAAPLYYRALFRHQPLTRRAACEVVDRVLAGIRGAGRTTRPAAAPRPEGGRGPFDA